MFSLKAALSSVGLVKAKAEKAFSLRNNYSIDIVVSLEPVPHEYTLEPGGTVDVLKTRQEEGISVQVGRTADGTPYFTIWPDGWDVRIERNGKDVFAYE